jgi:predicted ribosome quality control (RQC) complex YloA/Tae2 family protein
MQGAVFINKGTDADQAGGLAEELGHEYSDELDAFLLTRQELADILNANLQHIANPMETALVSIAWPDRSKPLDIVLYGNHLNTNRLNALLKGYQKTSDLMQWIISQDRLRIERWWHPNSKQSVSVFTALDDEDEPSGKADTTLAALLQAKAKQER